MLNKNQAYVVGYYGMSNTGDDALMCSAIWGANSQLGDSRILTTSSKDLVVDEELRIDKLPQPKFRGHQRLLHYKNALQSEKVIFGGGSVLHSEKDINFKRHLIGLAGRKNSRCIGVGIEPFSSVKDEKACAKFLNECGFIGLRDEQSYRLAKSLSPDANLHLTFDLAPTMLLHPRYPLKRIETQGIMFNFCQKAIDAFGSVDEKEESARIDLAVKTITNCWADLGEPLFLLDFNGHEKFGDQHVHQKILDRLPTSIDITHVPYDPNPYRVLQKIAGFKAVVAMRLHASIMSFMSNTPCISINYHKKCTSWCEQVGVPMAYRFDAQDLSSNQLTEAIIQSFGTGFAVPTMSRDDAVQAALLNWRQ